MPTLRQLASRPSTKTSTSHPRPSLSISIRSVRRHISRRLKHRNEDEFTDLDSQSGFGSIPPVEVVLTERERGWVVLLPESPQVEELASAPAQSQSHPPPIPEKDHCMTPSMCLSFGSPTRGDPADDVATADTEEKGRVYQQSPHIGHRSPEYHRRQSVLSYISVGRWSASTQGLRRRRSWVMGITIVSIVGIIVLTGVLAGVLSKRQDD